MREKLTGCEELVFLEKAEVGLGVVGVVVLVVTAFLTRGVGLLPVVVEVASEVGVESRGVRVVHLVGEVNVLRCWRAGASWPGSVDESIGFAGLVELGEAGGDVFVYKSTGQQGVT